MGSTSADEDVDDGVLIPDDLRPGITIRLPVTIYNVTGNDAYLSVWIDWNGDEDFDDVGETIALNTYDYATYNNSFQVLIETAIPANAALEQNIAARFRLSTDDVAIATPCGVSACAIDGEIEDYLIQIACPPEVCLPVQLTINRGGE